MAAAVLTGCSGSGQQAVAPPAATSAAQEPATHDPAATTPGPPVAARTTAPKKVQRTTPGRKSSAPRTPAVFTSKGAPVRTTKPAQPLPVHRAAALAASAPVRLTVPAIGVDSSLMRLGLASDGSLQVPPGAFPAGWYTGSPSPGELGPAVIVGHVDWGGRLGVFARLAQLHPGDRATVVRADGGSATFQVTRVERFAKDAFPTQQVYGDIDHAGLRLITCGGEFDRSAHSYVDDVVVFADLVD